MTQLIVALDAMIAVRAHFLQQELERLFGKHPHFWGIKLHQALIPCDLGLFTSILGYGNVFADFKSTGTDRDMLVPMALAGAGARFVTVSHGSTTLLSATVAATRNTKAELLVFVGASTDTHDAHIFIRRACEARAAGFAGTITPPELLRSVKGDEHLATGHIVVPGIRLWGGSLDGHSGPLTPQEARDRGATHIVVGRPITESEEPYNVVETVLNQLEW